MNKLKYLLLITIAFQIISSCKKTSEKEIVKDPVVLTPPETLKTVYPLNTLDSLSNINKTTSWYNTNKSFDQLFNVHRSLYWGFEVTANGLIPYNTSTTSTWSANKSYYWNDLGSYLYTDLTGDGKKDLWAYYWKNPWPTNAPGLHLFSEYESYPGIYDLQPGLVQVRKNVLADLNNDKKNEIVLFSSGYDAMPFPGDVIGIFHVDQKKYQYLTNDIGYFHGGATGDINNDGLVDIVAYSGGSAVIPVHPTAYINKGNGVFELSNHLFKGFNTSDDNYYTVELFDINKDGLLDLFLGGSGKLNIIIQKNKEFVRQEYIAIPLAKDLEVIDIAFLDFNWDGNMDVLTMSNKNGYQGYELNLFQNTGSAFIDVTSKYFNSYAGQGKNSWIKWIHLFDYDKDGDIDVVGDGLFGDLMGTQGRKIWWKNNGGKFVQVME
jgi:hypothetical protein